MNNVPVQPTVVEYKVCRANSGDGLAAEVNAALKQGFTVHGPMMLHGATSLPTFMQPLVKIELRPVKMTGMDSSVMSGWSGRAENGASG